MNINKDPHLEDDNEIFGITISIIAAVCFSIMGYISNKLKKSTSSFVIINYLYIGNVLSAPILLIYN